jgi:metal-responsive CopG/Arc/MetJ family transcriptional regulator
MAVMVRITITIDRELLLFADREARRLKISRSEFFRRAVRAFAKNSDRDSRSAAPRLGQ